MSAIYSFLVIILLFTSIQDVKGILLDEVLEDYRKTLPVYPKRGTSDEETALRAAQFVFHFMEEEKSIALQPSLNRIDLSCPRDSLMDYMMFHTYYEDAQGGNHFKDTRDQQIGSIYRSFLDALQHNAPIVGPISYHGFKSAYIYNAQTKKGKVLSRDVDLQERVNYETYRYLQDGIRQVGIDFHFIVLRDTFLALAFNLSLDKSEKIYKGAPAISKYGQDIQKIANETNIMTLDFCDLKNILGNSFDVFIENNLKTIIDNAKEVPNEKKVCDMKCFLKKEYEYESCSNTQKEKRAMERAKRNTSIMTFMRKYEDGFLLPTFMNRFGDNVIILPFSTQVENHLEACKKIPLRNSTHFLGGCNSQHQLPLLQQKQDGTYKFYTIRSDYMNKLFEKKSDEIILTDVDNYKTFLYKGDESLGAFFKVYK